MGRGVLRGCGRVDLGSAKTPNVAGFTRHHPKEVPILAPLEGYILFSPDLGDFLCPLQPPALLARAFPAEPVPRRGTGSVCSDPPRGPAPAVPVLLVGGDAGAEGRLRRVNRLQEQEQRDSWGVRGKPTRAQLSGTPTGAGGRGLGEAPASAGTRVLRCSGQSHGRGPDAVAAAVMLPGQTQPWCAAAPAFALPAAIFLPSFAAGALV